MAVPTTKVLCATWVVPVVPRGTVLKNHAVVVEKEKIVKILPSAEAEASYPANQLVRLPGHVLMPGLINMHGHSPMNLLRGFADDLELMEWLTKHIWPAEAAHVSPQFVYDGATLAIVEMLRGGTTTFADMYFFPEEVAKAVKKLGIRAAISTIFIKFPTAYAKSSDEYWKKAEALVAAYGKGQEPRITVTCGPHSAYGVEPEDLAKIAVFAGKHKLRTQIHLHESQGELHDHHSLFKNRPLEHVEKAGLLGSNLIAAHMVQLTDEEIKLVAKHGVHPVHCPQSNMKLASGIAPVAKLLDAGVNVCLGTDGAASNNDLNMWAEIQAAAMLGKVRDLDPKAVPAHAVIEMATINGARALGLEAVTGSIELIALDFSSIESAPMYNVMSHLVYSTDRRCVNHVWVAGRHVVDQGNVTTAPAMTELVELARKWERKIKRSSGRVVD